MKKKQFLIFKLLLMGVLIVFANSCKKDDDNNGNNSGDILSTIPVLTTTTVTDITQTTAISGGDITDDGGTTVTVRGVCWCTNENPTIDDNITEDGMGTGSFMSSIADLEPSTTYYVRAYATNSIGTGYGNIISFQTFYDIVTGSFTDIRDGNVYQTVTIGDQIWMAENLAYLPSVVCGSTSNSLSETTPFYYVYDYYGTSVNDAKSTSNYQTYGVLYNWPAAMAGSVASETNPSGVKGVCPDGWHLPSEEEWRQLQDFLSAHPQYWCDGNSNYITKSLALETGWNHTEIDPCLVGYIQDNSNATGFSAKPGGSMNNHGVHSGMGEWGFWWCTTEGWTGSGARCASIYYLQKQGVMSAFAYTLSSAKSVRCVKD